MHTQQDNYIDDSEVKKFGNLAQDWWDVNGPLKTLHDINPVRLDFIDKFIKFENTNILDVGCGAGILSEAMAIKGGKVVGLDLDKELIKIATHHAKTAGVQIEYVAKALDKYEHESFDVITSLEMLEHVNNPEKVIEHCARLLKPEGYLFLSTINRTLKSYLLVVLAAEHVLNIIPKNTHEYAKFIKPSELNNLLRQNNFKVCDLKGLNYNPITRNAYLTNDISMNYILAAQKIK